MTDHDKKRDEDHAPNDEDRTPKPGEWTDETYPLVDADFVGDTLDRVLHDRDEIDHEAARCEEIQFHRQDLDTYTVPDASPDFVESTLKKVLVERDADRRLRSAEDDEFHALMDNATVPQPSPDFVDRTLDLVMQDRAKTPILRPLFARPYSVAASVAAIILCAVAVFWRSDPSLDQVPPATIPIAAPVMFAPLVQETDAEPAPELGLPIDAPNDLEMFAGALGGDR